VRVPVRLGLRGDGALQVLEGLSPGEPVLAASAAVAPGARVRTEPAR
jgi:HlyD family secretion protein